MQRKLIARPQLTRIETWQGDTFTLQLVVRKENDDPYDVTAATGGMEVRDISTNALVASGAYLATNPTEGECEFTIADTSALKGEYRYDTQLTDNGKTQTLAAGRISFGKQVTV